MKKLMAVVSLVFMLSGPAFAKEGQLEKATSVLHEIMDTPDKGIPHDLFKKAVCVGIVPSELKGAFLVGGSFGRGVLVCRRHGNGPWGAPSDVVFIVMNVAGARKLVADEVKLGADAAVAAGPVGRNAQGTTDVELHAEILSYSRSRGLFAGVSLSGAVLKTDNDANKELYGRDVTAKQILLGGEVAVPPEARPLDRELARYSPRGGRSLASLQQ